MIRLLDRYVSVIFVSATAVFTAAFTALFVTVDFASSLGKFLELRKVNIVTFVLWYYSVRIPLFLALLLPMVVLFAAIFTIIKLQRTNEVLPIAASGISLRRMTFPFLAAAILTGGLVAVLEEFVLPKLAPELARTEEIKSSREVSFGVADYVESGLIWGLAYDHVKQEMQQGVRVTLLDAARKPVVLAQAKRAAWDLRGRRWVAFEGIVEYVNEIRDVPGQRPQPRIDPIPPDGWPVPAPFKIESLRTSASAGDRYAFVPIREILREGRARPDQPLWKMRFHSRLAFPTSPIVLMLVGLPSVVAAHSKSFVRGLTICTFQIAAYYVAYFVLLFLGNHGALPPPFAAWAAPAAFGAFGLFAYSRMKT